MSLPKPDFDPTPYDVTTVTDEQRQLLLDAAEAVLDGFLAGEKTGPSAIALAQMVKDYLS